MCLKIGVLVPTSNHIAFKAQDILKALEMGLTENAATNFEISMETTANNADKSIVSGKLQDLLIKQQVDVVVAPLNTGLLPYVNKLFESQQVPLIVNTLGEDVLFDNAQSPYTFVNSFNLWQSIWMSGYWGAAQYGKKACSMTALHEAGYGMTFSFGLGLEANGAKLLQTTVTHRETRTQDPSGLLKEMVNNQPDFIMGLYSGKEALSFLTAYHEPSDAKETPLICSPFAVDGSSLNTLGTSALNIHSISSWQINSTEDKHFKRIFKQRVHADYPPNGYALLAYETGHLIASAMQRIDIDHSVNGKLMDALKTVKFTGPRGSIGFHPETQETTTKNYLQEVVADKDGQLYNNVIAELETPPIYFEQLNLARKNLPKQGWWNPYLIT